MLNSVIDVGELKDVFVIQQKTEGTDENGFPKEEYVDLYRLRCKKKNQNTKKSTKSDKDSIEVTVKFICRKREIDNKMVILYKGLRYDIDDIYEFDDYFIEITAKTTY